MHPLPSGNPVQQGPIGPKNGSYRAQKTAKTSEKLRKSCFSQKLVFHYFKWYLGGLGVSGGMARTIRGDSLELWPGLVSHGMGEVDVHVFWKKWKRTSSPSTSKLVLGPPDWSSDFFESQGTISGAIKPINFPKNDPTKQKRKRAPGQPSKIVIC